MSTIAFTKTVTGIQFSIDGGTPFILSGDASVSANSDDDMVIIRTDSRDHPIKSSNTFTINGISLSSTSAAALAANFNATLFATGSLFKIYRALLTQSGTAAPTAVVLQNTLGGTIVWTRTSAGLYAGTLTGAFPSGKVFTVTGRPGTDSSSPVYVGAGRATADAIAVGTGVSGSANSDSQLNNTPIEILVLIS